MCQVQRDRPLRSRPLLRAPPPFLLPVFPGTSLRVRCLSSEPGAGAPYPPPPLPVCTSPSPARVTQDVADFEWVMWFTSFRNIIVFALSGHVLFAKLCTMVAPQVSWVCGT